MTSIWPSDFSAIFFANSLAYSYWIWPSYSSVIKRHSCFSYEPFSPFVSELFPHATNNVPKIIKMIVNKNFLLKLMVITP